MNLSRLISVFLLHITIICAGQPDFLPKQDNIFTQSETQWLCNELLRVNPSHFDCNAPQHSWTLPKLPTCTLFGVEIPVSEEERETFRNLLFPGEQCQRYLKLLALCDLYFPLFRKKAESLGLHRDYQLLPLMLSGCNQNYFSSTERSGLWAMDYLTGRKIHLRIDKSIDERRGGDFTTDVILHYMEEISTRYNRDPFKTIHAYRLGVHWVNMTDTTLTGVDYILSLNPSDQQFYKCMAYFNELISTTRTTNQLNTCFDIFALSESIVFERQVSFEALHNILNIDRQQLHDNNPVYTGLYVEPGYRRVPFMLDKVAALKFEALKDSVYNWQPEIIVPIFEEPTADEVIRYKVRRGDSLGKIASRHRVTVSQIKSWNKLKGDRISKGQILTIHQKKKGSTSVSKPKEENNEKQASEPTNEEQAAKLLAKGDQCMKKKDYACAVKAFKEAEVLNPTDRRIKDKLKIAEESLSSPPKANDKTIYTVKSGDSLWGIAQKYKGVTEQDIMKWNKCDAKIRPGQKLIIYTK